MDENAHGQFDVKSAKTVIRVLQEGDVRLPPAIQRLAIQGGVVKMLKNGMELSSIAFDDYSHPTQVVFVFGDGSCVSFSR